MQLDDTLVKIAQTASANSCRKNRQKIKGECYVSHDKNRKNAIEIAKKAILGVAAVAVMTIGIKTAGDIDSATIIREEATKTETSFNVVGGTYETNNFYDENFINSINDLSDASLNNLFQETRKEMMDSGNIEEAKIVSEVVEEMEENFLEEQGRSR